MAQTCTRSLARMMQTSSRDGIHASKVYQHQQHAAPPARTRRSEMHEGTHSSRTAHAIEPGPKMQTRPDLDRVCILGPEQRQWPSAAQRVPSIAIVNLIKRYTPRSIYINYHRIDIRYHHVYMNIYDVHGGVYFTGHTTAHTLPLMVH